MKKAFLFLLLTFVATASGMAQYKLNRYTFSDSASHRIYSLKVELDLQLPEPNSIATRLIYDTLMLQVFDTIYVGHTDIEAFARQFFDKSFKLQTDNSEEEYELDSTIFYGKHHLNWYYKYKLTQVREDSAFVSFTFNFTEYTGGANSDYGIYYYNFDRCNGVLLRVGNVFKSQYVKGDLPHLLLQELPNSEQFTELSDYWSEYVNANNNFLVTPQGLEFYYNVYELAPRAQGPTIIKLSKEQLKPYIRDISPLYKYWYQ